MLDTDTQFDLEHLASQMKRAIFDTLRPLQTTKELDTAAFARLDQLAQELAQRLRGSEHLPRAVVNALYSAAKAMLNEAPYARDPALVEQWASKLFMSFDLILLGESHADYTPGVPRIR